MSKQYSYYSSKDDLSEFYDLEGGLDTDNPLSIEGLYLNSPEMNTIAPTNENNSVLRYRSNNIKKKREKKKKRKIEIPKNPQKNRRTVNLPASKPYIRIIDGEERLCFKYNTKLSETALSAMPRTDLEENEFCVRFDLENVDVNKLNDKFKIDNCIYPRANVPVENYTGNRWEYETECNKLALQFVSLNPLLLYGKKGLIQRAVDSFRNYTKSSRGRRIVKLQDKSIESGVQRQHADYIPPTVTIFYTSKGYKRNLKIRTDVDLVNYEAIEDDFKKKYSVFVDYYDHTSFGRAKWETNNPANILAIKVAYLNVDNTPFWNAIKATDKKTILRASVEAIDGRPVNEYNYDEKISNRNKDGISVSIEDSDQKIHLEDLLK